MNGSLLSRRRFLGALSALPASLGALLGTAPGAAALESWTSVGARLYDGHPDPRPGIDGSKVLTAEQLRHHGVDPSVVPIYEGVREFAHLVDGIRCYCGCAEMPGYRSLLTCFEEDAMAAHCPVCQGQAELVVGRAREGQSLDRIRRVVDARWKHLEPNRR